MNMTPLETQELFREIKRKLTEPFPPGTVESRENDEDSKYIPAQAYIHRLEEAAGTFWSWQPTGAPIIYEREQKVMVTGVLRILEAERSGTGFSNFQIYNDSGKIKNIQSAIKSAESDAIRDACDKFEMGWKDLAPYREWGKNPGVGINTSGSPNTSKSVSQKICAKCRRALTPEDLHFLAEMKLNIFYCREHIPAHFIAKAKLSE